MRAFNGSFGTDSYLYPLVVFVATLSVALVPDLVDVFAFALFFVLACWAFIVEKSTRINKKEIARKKTEDALKAFRKASGLSSGGFEALPEFVNLIKAFVNEGLVNLKDVIDRFRKEFPTIKVSDEDIEKKFKEATEKNILIKFADKTDNNFIRAASIGFIFPASGNGN